MPNAAAGAGVDRLREILIPLQGLALPVEQWERDILPRRLGAYSPTWMDQLCSAGEIVWVGAGALGRKSGRVALYFRSDVALLGPPHEKTAIADDHPMASLHNEIRTRLSTSASFFTDLLADLPDVSPTELQEALWDLVWAGDVTNDAFAPLRWAQPGVQRKQPARQQQTHRRFTRRRGDTHTQVQGRWSLTNSLFTTTQPDPSSHRRATAELLLERYGIITREQILAEGIPGGFSGLYDQFSALETLGIARRGYFIEGLGGAQFALPGAVERMRARNEATQSEPLVLAATDPAQPYGASLAWPKQHDLGPQSDESQTEPTQKGSKKTAGRRAHRRRVARQAGAYVVLDQGEPTVYVERNGKGIQTLIKEDDARLSTSLNALVQAVRNGQMPRLSVERINGEFVLESPLLPQLIELGFSSGPRKITLHP